jgi:Zn-dependent M28 family amino/carboxypeptidase
MRQSLIIAALLALSPLPALADDLPQASADAIRGHVTFLADDLLEGRGTASRGYQIAAHYVATQLAALGLQPAGVDGSWLQPVELLESTRVVPAARASIERDGQRIELEPAVDFLPGNSYFGTAAEVTAPLVFVGFGITAPELAHDDFGTIDVRGKVAVVLSGAPAQFPNNQRAHHSRNKTPGLVARGAVGIVYVDTPESELRSPWQKSVLSAWVPSMRLVAADGQLVDAYPEIKASLSLNIASASKLFDGGPKTLEEIWADATAGKPQAFDLPATISISLRSALSNANCANVVGLLPGADPELANEYVVFTAHLDHIGKGAAVNGDTIYNGALDNASGIATMLETARLLATAPERPKRSILFVAVTAEERGLLGSRHFGRNPTVPKEAIVANVNTDMPVLLYPAAGLTPFGAEHSTLGAVAQRAIEAEGLTVVPDPSPEEVRFVRSDQYSFVREGIPAIYIKDGQLSSDPEIDAAALFKQFMQRDYHMPSDQVDLPIHWPSFARLAQVNARIGLAIANDPVRPSWLPGDFFGETFGKH